MSSMGAGRRVKRVRRAFSREFKEQAVRLVLDEGKTVGAAARGLPPMRRMIRRAPHYQRAERSLLAELPAPPALPCPPASTTRHQGQKRFGRQSSGGVLSGRDAARLPACE